MIANYAPIVITPATQLAVTLKEAQDQTNAIPGEDDALLRRLIAAAAATVQTDAAITLCPQRVKLSYFDIEIDPREIEIPDPFYPVTSIVSVQHRDAAGALQTINPSVYQAALIRPARVKPNPDKSWPAFADGYYDSLAITIDVGTENPPEQAKHAILLLVAHWFLNREAALTGAISSEVKLAYDTLINQLKLYRYP